MPCILQQVADGVQFICTRPQDEDEELALCAFCGKPSTCLCDWPVKKQGRFVSVKDLKVGAWIYLSSSSKEPKEIVDIEVESDFVRVLHIAGLSHSKIEDGTRRRLVIDAFRVPESGTCDKPCCDACHRCVGEDRIGEDIDYCRDHWWIAD